MEISDLKERRRGRREADLALIAHLTDVFAEDPDAVFSHSKTVIDQMKPAGWVWRRPGGELVGSYTKFDPAAAGTADGSIFRADQVSWLEPAAGIVYLRTWSDGELFAFSRAAEVEGSERWEAYLAWILSSLLRGTRRASEKAHAVHLALYGDAQAETMEKLRTAAERTRRVDMPLSVAFVRLVGMKELNELRGLAVGDRAYIRMAELIRQDVEIGDGSYFGRAGTDGMLVIFPGKGRGAASKWTDRVSSLMRKMLHEEISRSVEVQATVCEIPGDANDVEGLLAQIGIIG